VEQVADLLGISRAKAYQLIASGELPGIVRIGRSVRVSRASLEAWVNERASGSAMSSSEAEQS
jgi:excisionase family DNA binding protein